MSLFEVRELTRVYGSGRNRVVALDGVSLDVAAGQRLGIVGESGSGKSTLVRLMAALDRPTSGEVRFAGRPVTGVPERGWDSCDRGSRWCSRTPARRWTHGCGSATSSPSPSSAPSCGPNWARSTAPAASCRCWRRWACRRRPASGTRTSSPEGSGSGSRSPGRSPPPRTCSSPTRPSPRSTCRSGRRCSTC
ncbi:ATP-binding cassette domain-containing protein [Propioniciclava coleopterorum]|uniref:ATP-binding cassette domain-containing protein n=1 Tax=Propioniciclava coleopterorum TaxID=2714937 RepID=A0A6G7Y9K6_9ACTN|nr:ATP-binding cassette domain-containing protein [Propioniciclava coleopterorum]